SWPQARARTDELLGAFELSEAANRSVKTYSGGMRRRIDLAASMVISPRVLFLDEPTTGLDPRSRGQVWEIVRLLVADGATVLLTTQYLDEADQLAHRICVIDHGRVIAQGTPGELKASVGTGALSLRVVDPADRSVAADVVARVLGTPVELAGDVAALAARVPDDDDAPRRAASLLPELHAAGVRVAEFSLGQPSLDEVFLALTGRRAEPDAGESPEAAVGPEASDEEVA
ncbi:MAG: ATP-binding cassette domain-containing protein, partial [Actinomycetales bacterium]|nr:ATP-binding cassette domain-containing protein [Actinomycetales bacterium]